MTERTTRQRPDDALASPATGIPLEHLDFRVAVTGLVAEVELEQRFGNRLERPLEAVYVFPLPEEALVRGAEVRIGSRTIIAEIRERGQAQADYAQARDAGHDAAMVEQERPNIFTISVARIEPGEQVHAVVRYAHRVPWQDSGGRLIVPTVVAPQFIPGMPVNAKGDTDEVPDASRITPPVVSGVPYRATVRATLRPGFPAEVSCPSHPDRVAPFALAPGEAREIVLEDVAPDGDVVLAYRTTAQFPVVTATRSPFTHRGEQEEYVIVQVFPGIMRASDRPLDAVFVLDDSGSMSGEKSAGLRATSRKVFQRAVRFGRPLRIAVERFDNEPQVLVPLSEISEGHSRALDGITGRGGTEFGPALSVAMGLLRKFPETHDRCIVVITDGDTASMQYARVAGVRVHMIGIDSAANRETLRLIAEETGGGMYAVLPGEDDDAAANEIMGLMSGPVLQEVCLAGLPDGTEIISVTDCYQLRPSVIAVRLPRRIEEITVVGRGHDGKKHRFTAKVTDAETPIGAQLWARAKLRLLQLQQREAAQKHREGPADDAFTQISLRYGILGPTTAFIAVSERAVPGMGKPERVDVPVMLPRTWDYDAVSGSRTSTSLFVGAAMLSGPQTTALRAFGGVMAARGAGPVLRRMTMNTTRSAVPASGIGKPGIVRRTLGALAGGVSRLTGGSGSGHDDALDGSEVFSLESERGAPQVRVSSVIRMAEQLLSGLQAGGDTSQFRAEWEALARAFQQLPQHGLSEGDRCRLFELFTRISQHDGFEIEIPSWFREMPKDVNGTAYRQWERAMIVPIRAPKPGAQAAR